MKYLLDTTVLIDFLRGKDKTVDRLRQLASEGNELLSCCITVAELYSGLRPSERKAVDSLIDSLSYVTYGSNEAKAAGSMRLEWSRRGRTLSVADCLVAVAAMSNDAVLLTANAKHFPHDGLRLEVI